MSELRDVSRWLVAACLLGATVTQAAPPARGLPDFSSMVEANGPAVVNISTTQVIKRTAVRGAEPESPENGPFNDLLRRYFGDEETAPDAQDNKTLGSGFIVSADGYILTCAHVVENATEILVRMHDRREFVARLVGADRRSDVALLKIDASNLPMIRAGDPNKVKVGEWVLAIGSPFGFEASVTAGIVSAKGRSLPRENYVPFIQTDVAINQGNSGGPLFNLQGEVIGMNSQIFSRTGGFMGLSFAIPIDIATQVSQQLKASGRVRRGWLGVTINDLTRDLAESFGLKRPAGALIADILPDSPAARADLRIGDIVTEYDGTKINLSSDLPLLVGRTLPGNRARLTVLRNQQPRAVMVTIAELPEERTVARAEPAASQTTTGLLGMQARDLSPAQMKQIGVTGGVLIEKVAEGPAYKAGIRAGDVILQVQGKGVRSIAELREKLGQLPRQQPVPLLVRRGAASLFLALRHSE